MRIVVGVVVAIAGCSFHLAPALDTTDEPDAASNDGVAIDAACEQPAAHWRFDEGIGLAAADSSGRGNALTLMGTATWGPGHTGTAISLPGGSWATVPFNATFEATRHVSVTAWINPTASRTGGIVVKSARLGPRQDWGFYQEFAEAMFICNWPAPDLRGTTSGLALATGLWTHVGFVLDVDAGTTAFYKNGVLHSTRPMTTPLLENNEPITVGTDGGNTANDFIGSLDEITVWTRALTAAEVATLHAGDCLLD